MNRPPKAYDQDLLHRMEKHSPGMSIDSFVCDPYRVLSFVDTLGDHSYWRGRSAQAVARRLMTLRKAGFGKIFD